jgi:hypothetical protein
MTSESTLTRSSKDETASRTRPVTAIARGLAATILLVALVFQIVEKTVNNDMVPGQYFMFFTIQGAMITITVLFLGGISALRLSVDSTPLTVARLSVLSYAVVTAVVYNVLLRGIPDEGFVTTPWPGEIMHVWIPIFIVLDWMLAPGRPAVKWNALGIVVIYPLTWVAATLVRGAVTGWYPYPFLEPSTGVASVALYVVAIAAFIVANASVGIVLARATHRRTLSTR